MDERVREVQGGEQQTAQGGATAQGWRVVVFANVSLPPFANNLEGPLKALAELAAISVIDPLSFPRVRSTGGAAPLAVPEAAVTQALAFQPHVVLCLGGGLFLPAEQRERFASSTVFAGLALSDPQALPASLAIAPHFHLFYTQDFQSLAVYRAAGIAARRLDLAADPEAFKPLSLHKQWDVVFIGKWTPWRNQVVSALAEELQVAVFTHQGEGRWTVPARGPLLSTQALCQAFNRSRLALEVATVDDLAKADAVPRRITPRAFMAAACGTPVLVEGCPSVEAFFQPGEEVVTFQTAAEAVRAAKKLLADPVALAAMGQRARQRVLRQHTWHHRMRQLLADAQALVRGCQEGRQ